MAVPTLDVSLLGYFTPVFTFVLVLIFTFSLFRMTKIFGDGNTLPIVVGVVLAIIFMLSVDLARIVMFIAPWFSILFIFALFLLMFFKIFGATDDQIHSVITNHSGLRWVIIIAGIIIMIAGFSAGLGPKWLGYTRDGSDGPGPGEVPSTQYESGELRSDTPDFYTNVAGVFFNPKVLGLVFLLLIATFTIKTLGDPMGRMWPPLGGGGGGH